VTGALAVGVPVLAALAVRMLASTLRMTARGVDHVAPLWASGRPLIYVMWHVRVLLMPWISAGLRRRHGARRVTVLASRSRDGGLAGAYVHRFGLGVVRGSSSRGGAAGLRALAQVLSSGDDVAVVPDGPRGPRYRLQPGAVVLAALTGAPIVPLAYGARPARRLSTWDEMLVPAPFGRCALVFGAPMTIARHADREAARADVERALLEVTAAADRLVDA
jgi:hypothetical protein